MIKDVPLDRVEDNPFNSRLSYSSEQIELLARSIEKYGLLSPAMVRRIGEKYQLVYGHRRARALRLLKLPMIRADVQDLTDEQMLHLSYAENVVRADLSDYEKALYFEKMNIDFGKTYEEIGAVYNVSRAQICNYVRMTRLFDELTLLRDHSVVSLLVRITERHARALSRVGDPAKRLSLLKSTVEDGLSVRDLERMIVGFRGWLDAEVRNGDVESPGSSSGEFYLKGQGLPIREGASEGPSRRDLLELRNALESEFRLPRLGDFQSFDEIFAKDPEYGLFSMYAGGSLKLGREALKVEEDWFYSIGRNVTTTISDFRAQFFGNIALATCRLDVEASSDPKVLPGSYGGTVVFVNRHRRWKILHEHWSKLSTPNVWFDCSPGKTAEVAENPLNAWA